MSEHDGPARPAGEREDPPAEESLHAGGNEHLAAEPPPEISVAQALPSAPGPRALLAVVPVEAEGTPAWDAADARLGVTLVPYRDIAALLCPAAAVGETATEDVKARHWEVHRALLRGTVVPAPIGVTFSSDGDVEKFLTEAYGTLKGALARVEGRWEFRLHVDLTEAGLSESLALDLVTHIYAELRRTAHAAIPFQRKGGRLLSAAFLVDRTGSVAFQDRVEELGRVNGALALDLTGPWPPYDFVQMHG